MSLNDHRGAAFYFRELMRAAEADIQHGGEIKPARVIYKNAKASRVRIDFMKRLLRGTFLRRA